MIDVSIFISPILSEKLAGDDRAHEVYAGLRKIISNRLINSASFHTGPIASSCGCYFVVRREEQVITNNLLSPKRIHWFVGAYAMRQVLSEYFAVYVVGHDDPLRTTVHHITALEIQRQAEEVYSEKLLNNPYEALDRILYELPRDSCPNLTFQLTDENNVV